jgi:nucleotide-binding universal stress UspA family protein
MTTVQPDPTLEGPIRNVLVPTDFSKNAGVALRWAVGIAAAHDASMVLLHAVDLNEVPLELQRHVTERLEELEEFVGEDGVEVTSLQTTGRPWKIIAREAAAFDLVVIGARGHTPHAGLALGSTADRVLRASPAPVLTIHPEDTEHGHLPRHVIVPTDFSPTSELALRSVTRLLRDVGEGPLEITLLHAWQPLVDYDCAFTGAALRHPLDGTEEQARSLVEAMASECQVEGVKITPVVRQGYPTRVVVNESKSIGADLVALGTHGRSGLTRFVLGSVAERVVHAARCPVLSVREPVENLAAPDSEAAHVTAG